MSCDVGEVTESLKNELCLFCDVGEAREGMENKL